MYKKTLAAAAAVLAAFVIAGCSSEPTPRELAEAAINDGWSKSSAEDRDGICMGIGLFGKDGVAVLMRGSVEEPGAPELDWDYAVEVLEQKCEAR